MKTQFIFVEIGTTSRLGGHIMLRDLLTQYGPAIWTPILDPQYGPQIWTPNMDPQYGSPFWTPNMDPQYGPPIWTPNMDPQCNMDYRPPIWTPNCRLGGHILLRDLLTQKFVQ
jgi:hypothetical protein